MLQFDHIICISPEASKTRRAVLKSWALQHKMKIEWIIINDDDYTHKIQSDAHLKCFKLAIDSKSAYCPLIMEDRTQIESITPDDIPVPPAGWAMLMLNHNIFNLHPTVEIPHPSTAPSWLHSLSTIGIPRAYFISRRLANQILNLSKSTPPAPKFNLANILSEIQANIPTYGLRPQLTIAGDEQIQHPLIQTCKFKVENKQCTLTLQNHPQANLPRVSIVVPTYNRAIFARQIKMNVKRQLYPHYLLQLIIIDDSDIPNYKFDIPNYISDVVYHRVVDRHMTIPEKRNLGASLATGDIIAHMDDDDVYFAEYISTAVNVLMDNPEIGCVGSTVIGCYDIIRKTSYTSGSIISFLSEAPMVYRKSFWAERNFDNNQVQGEGIPFQLGRTDRCMQIPFMFMMIAITHKSNITPNRISNNNDISVGDNIMDILPVDSGRFLSSLRGPALPEPPASKLGYKLGAN